MFTPGEDFNCEIQIDESVFGKACKYSRGRPHRNYWLFGLSAQPKSHKVMLKWVDRRDKSTLIPLIKEHAPPSAQIKIISDGWASYEDLAAQGYDHAVVIHKETFVNETGDHTNSIESVWSQLKNWIRSMHGLKYEHKEGYLAEFMFRYNEAGGSRAMCFAEIIREITKQYKV